MPPEVDLVITFRASHKSSVSKQQTREDAQKAERQYSQLLETLSYAGLQAVGRRGETLGHLLVFVKCPEELLQTLVKRERQSDFLSGLPTSPITDGSELPLASSDRLRIVNAYLSSIPADGGLGIIPGTTEWDLVESVMCLHDQEFNEKWIHAWTTSSTVASISTDTIRAQFGDSVALYFSFLHFYAKALIFPAALGLFFYFFGTPYSPIYSSLILIWSITFVEWWRVRERLLALHFGTRGSFKVERRRAQYTPGFSWWKREVRMLASLPVILLFAGILIALLTSIFVFEAFVTQLYAGPGQKYLGFSPTILFVLLVPRLLALYQSFIRRFTAWENHAHHSTHTASLTLKTFALSSLVAYLGLALSAFVYVPFGEGLMHVVQVYVFPAAANEKLPSTGGKLNPGRLRDQMFAYTVTQQISGTFLEIGLPYIMRWVDTLWSKKGKSNKGSSSPGGKKKVVFEDEKERGGLAEREFLEQVRREAALPEYELFGDYNEMVTQFGYVALWSTIWPLAPVMALINNFFELRSDAFKITVHNRRPIPSRADTIGPWLDALTFLTWLAALTNAALVYLFCPRSQANCANPNSTRPLSSLDKVHQHLILSASVNTTAAGSDVYEGIGGPLDATYELLGKALLIALAASHGYMLVRLLIRHVVERVVWKGSEEVRERDREDREVKVGFLKSVGGEVGVKEIKRATAEKPVGGEGGVFWDHDEGVEEIQRISKEV